MRPEKYSAKEIVAAVNQADGVITRAARLLGCSTVTVYRYAERYESVSSSIDKHRQKAATSSKLVFPPSQVAPLFSQVPELYTEDHLRNRLCSTASQWCTSIGIPEPERVSSEVKLDGVRIDILLHHSDSVTIVEVKKKRKKAGARCEYQTPGQLLYYRQTILDCGLLQAKTVNLVAAIDWKPSERLRSIIKNVTPRIHLLSIRGLCGLS